MSQLSDVNIANMALDAMGSRTLISSLQENSVEAKACARNYLPALTQVTQAAAWNFCRFQGPLTLLLDGSKTPPDAVPTPWRYEYAYPSDCIQARYIMPLINGGIPTGGIGVAQPVQVGSAVRFLVGVDNDQGGLKRRVILTNQPSAILVYSVLITDTSIFDEQFVTAFANYLAHRISLPLSGDKATAKMCYELATRTCQEAEASNGNEGLTVIDSVPDWIRTRGYSADWAYPPGSYSQMPSQALMMIT